MAVGSLINRRAILLFLRGLLAAELNSPSFRAKLFKSSLDELEASSVGDDGLGLDSLARIDAATCISAFAELSVSGVDDYLLVSPTFGDWVDLVEQHFRVVDGSAHVTFKTSGSVDRPRSVRHSLASLAYEVDSLSGIVGPIDRVLTLIPLHHVFGFIFAVIYPSRISVPVEDAHFRPPEAAFRSLHPGSLVVATPFVWQKLAELGRSFPPGLKGVTSGAPMPDVLWDELKRLGLSDLVEVYGSTETAGLGWRRSAGSPFRLLSHLRKSGPNIQWEGSSRNLEIQDNLSWLDGRHFLLKGRIDSALQVAGVNVSPNKVVEVLEGSEWVQHASVRLENDRLKAFVVPQNPLSPDEELTSCLEIFARDHLPAAARPVRYTFGNALPRNAMGKLSDW